MIGEMLGHYEITGKIGKGGMGVVYRATDTLIGREVALKTIQLREIEDPNERQFLKERLFREAKSAGILSHPNIVTVFQIGEQDGLTYIAMEFVDGPNLAELLNGPERPTLETLVSILDQCGAALDYAHSRGVVHRDIKPGNIIVRGDGVAKIADFGVAKISSQNVTRTGMTLGTPHYMSPEQFHGRAIDGRSDQYSLAVMVYEIFTGKKPFTADSITGLMYKILHEEPNPRRDNPDLSEDTDGILRKALSKEPDARYPSCSEFIQDLRGVSGIVLKALPFESHTRTPIAGTGSQRTHTPHSLPTGQGTTSRTAHTPIPTPTSGMPSAGMMPPPPPVPPSQAMSAYSETGKSSSAPSQSWNFRSPEAGAPLEDTPTLGTSQPMPPKSPIADAPTPPSGVPTAGGPSGGLNASGGINLPPPPAPALPATPGVSPSSKLPDAKAGTKASAAKASDPKASGGKADKGKAPLPPGKEKKPAAGGATAPPSKLPMLILVAVVVFILLAVGIGGILYFRSQQNQQADQTTENSDGTVDSQQAANGTPDTDPSTSPAEGTEGTTPVDEGGTPVGDTSATPANTTPNVQYAPPAIATFVAEPSSITLGQSATLRWNTSETTLVTIEPGLARGRSIGQISVSPKQTTTYRLVARGLGGRKTQELQITVRPKADDGGTPETGPNPDGMSLDAITRALSAGESVVSMNQLMVRVGLNGVSFQVTPQAQAAILAAGERGDRPKDSVVRLVDLAKRGGRR